MNGALAVVTFWNILGYFLFQLLLTLPNYNMS